MQPCPTGFQHHGQCWDISVHLQPHTEQLSHAQRLNIGKKKKAQQEFIQQMQERWAWHPRGASFPQGLAQAGHEPTSPPASLRFPPAMQPQQPPAGIGADSGVCFCKSALKLCSCNREALPWLLEHPPVGCSQGDRRGWEGAGHSYGLQEESFGSCCFAALL